MPKASVQIVWEDLFSDLRSCPAGLDVFVGRVGVRDHGVVGEMVFRAERRQHYCDRGEVLVHVDVAGITNPVDYADFFPRYYFDIGRAKAELQAFADKRKQCREYAEYRAAAGTKLDVTG